MKRGRKPMQPPQENQGQPKLGSEVIFKFYGDPTPDDFAKAVTIAQAMGSTIRALFNEIPVPVHTDSSGQAVGALYVTLVELGRAYGVITNQEKEIEARKQGAIIDRELLREERERAGKYADDLRARIDDQEDVIKNLKQLLENEKDARWTECQNVGLKCEQYSRKNDELNKEIEKLRFDLKNSEHIRKRQMESRTGIKLNGQISNNDQTNDQAVAEPGRIITEHVPDATIHFGGATTIEEYVGSVDL